MIRTVRIVCSGDHVLASAWYDGGKCSAAQTLETFSVRVRRKTAVRVRSALVEANLHLIRPIATRIRRRLPASFCLEDVIQAGAVGLVAASDTCDAGRGTPQQTAAARSSRCIVRWRNRKDSPVPRSAACGLRDNIKINGVRMSTQYVQLPEDLIAELRARATEQGKTVDQLAEETLRKGLEECAWEELLAYGAERGNAAGYTEADVPRLVKEWRRGQRGQ